MLSLLIITPIITALFEIFCYRLIFIKFVFFLALSVDHLERSTGENIKDY